LLFTMSEDELSKAIDLKHNIVRVALTNGSKKAYRIPDLRSKTAQQTLQLLLESPTCPLYNQSGVRLYEYCLSDLSSNLLEPNELMSTVLKRWENPAKKRAVYELLLKKEHDTEKLASPKVEIRHQFKRSASSLMSKKNKIVNTTRLLLQSMEPFVDENRCLYKPKSADNASLPLSQYLQIESQKQGFSMDDPEIIQIRQHQRILVTWVNFQLTERNMHISDLHKDIRDGVALINLLEILSGRSIKEYHKNPSSVQQKLQNCDLLIQFLNKLEVKCQAQPVDIFNGNMAVLFGVLYVVVKRLKEKKIIRDKKGKQRLISVDLRSDQKSPGGKLKLSQASSVGGRDYPLTERLMVEKSDTNKLHLSLSCTDLELQIQALDDREKIAIEDIMKLKKQSGQTNLAQSQSGPIISFHDSMDGPPGSNDNILDDILQTAKRLKEMKIARAPVIQKTKNINLSDLNDDELEALLNDGNFDIMNNLPAISLEFDDDVKPKDIRSIQQTKKLSVPDQEEIMSQTEFDDDLENLTLHISNELMDSDFNLDDL